MYTKLSEEVNEILNWNIQVEKEVNMVPSKDDLTLGKTARLVETCILFVDIRGSSVITETHRKTTMVKILNAFLNGVVRIAKSNYGHVRSFNGDSLLIIFDPDMDGIVCDKAVDTALKIKGFVKLVLLPELKKMGYEEYFEIGIGIDKDSILVSKVGIRGVDNNDLIWTSTGTNFSAKMGNSGTNILISENVFKGLSDKGLYSTDVNDNFYKKFMWSKSYFEFVSTQRVVYQTDWFRLLG
jgi:class 3 adenylate cyclase